VFSFQKEATNIMIKVENLTKEYTVKIKKPGLTESLKGLVKPEYQTKYALKQVSFELSPGQTVGLIGANGAGKTTLVKILSGIIPPSSGKASVSHFIPWERQPSFQKSMSLIMGQKAQLWWDLPASDCFLLLQKIYRIPNPDFQVQLNRLVEIMGVERVLNTQIRRLSLGERMKMELVASLLHKPSIIFLDEPTIGLDAISQRAMRQFLKEYQKENQPLILLTSHYMEDIEDLCTNVLVLHQGELVFNGALSQIKSQMQPDKLISVLCSNDLAAWAELSNFQTTFSKMTIMESNAQEGLLKLKAPKEILHDIVRHLYDKLNINDISIEDEDISLSIQKMINSTRRNG
jgi:ABC-2 type transport system ATP-binding protein